MRKIILFSLLATSLQLTVHAQYWQQQVDYTIDVSLNDRQHTLDGFEQLQYINHSPDTLRFIWFHCWPNAYKNDKTAFSDQLLENGHTRFYFSGKDDKGYINRLDFKVDNITAVIEDHPLYIDIVKLLLPSPLAPGQKIIITTPFHVKLPATIERGGHDGESYQVTQWYPKPAVYDSKGWHPMPYLTQGEFYSEFGSFDVSITLPENYAVAATGVLQNEEEKAWLKKRSSFSWTPEKKRVKTKGGAIKIIEEKFPPSSARNKTLRFKQDSIHDFAWFADKRFIVQQDTCVLPSGKSITAYSYYTPGEKQWWQASLAYSKAAIRFYSSLVGDYPYTTVSTVQGPKTLVAGMEYPTISVISPVRSAQALELAVNHETGHNWFYGILGSNERNDPWMDEGMTSYYVSKYGKLHNLPEGSSAILFKTLAKEKLDQPITTSSEKFSDKNYLLVPYYKTGEWLTYLEQQLGTEAFNTAMQAYYQQWQFKHPAPEDFKKAMEESSRKNLDSVFAYLDLTGELPTRQRKGTRLLIPFSHPDSSWSTNLPLYKNIITLAPAMGFNSYDKLMIGAFFTNLKLPPSNFQFFVAPMWGTGSKKLTGIGFVNYSFYPGGAIRKIDLGASAATFSANEFKREDGRKMYFGVEKFVPGIRLTLQERDPRSTLHHYLQWKTYFFSEEDYRVRYDSVITATDTTLKQRVSVLDKHRTLHQLTIVMENYRALYPYRGELKIEHAENFVRAAFTGNYFFNYAKEGGLDVRFFAGKFFYTRSKTITSQIATDRYHLNLTGANGYEDYTYSDYFLGRNKFEGLASQQIMVRDGAFKVRTDLLGDKVGRTDDWLIAANFSSTIPSGINPLSLLPVKIPLKVFVDVGTQAAAWEKDAHEDRFLFDAGIHIPLLKETVNIYLPLFYSTVFKDYKQSYLPKKNRFLKMISFSIDISHFNLRKFDRNLFF